MVRVGAAVLLPESDLQIPGKLLDSLVELLNAPERLAQMAVAARSQARPGAAERIAAKLRELASSR